MRLRGRGLPGGAPDRGRPAGGQQRPAGRRPAADAGQAGLSLIEVLVAGFIVGAGAVAVALMFGTGQAYVAAEGDNRTALFLAQQKIEQLKSQGYGGLVVTDATTSAPPATASETVDLTPAGGMTQRYTRTWSVVCVNRDNYDLPAGRVNCAAATSPAKRIDVTVEPTPADAKARAIALASVMADR